MEKTPMDDLKHIMHCIRLKHPNWSDKQVICTAKYAYFNPNWKENRLKEKIKQSVNEISKPYQISFEDLMNRGTCNA